MPTLKIVCHGYKSEKLIVDVYRMGSQPVKLDLIKGKNVNTVEIDKKGTYYVVFRGDRTTGKYDFNLKFIKKSGGSKSLDLKPPLFLV